MSTVTMMNGALHHERRRTHWLAYYTAGVTILGFMVATYAFANYENSWIALILFASATAIAELTSVRQFSSSHSHISMVAVTTIATLVILGPHGGVLAGLAGGIMTIVTTSDWFTGSSQRPNRVVWWRRSTFNMSLRMLSTAGAGVAYLWAGGVPGAAITVWLIPALVAAVIADELVNTLLLITVIHLQTGRRFLEIWRQDWEWNSPITLASSLIGGAGLAYAYNLAGAVGLSIFMLPIIATGYAFHLYVNRTRLYVDRLEEANGQLEEANLGLLQTLAAVVDAYDIYTFGHSAQVARYAKAIAKEMGLSNEEQLRIFRGGLIHDIGKIGVTDAIIGKNGRLTDEEYNALKLHTVIGADIVKQMPGFQSLVPLVRSHHERWDGRGYPDGLVAAENSLGARIMCVADSVEAMLSDRPYQSTRSLPSVIEEVIRCAGTQFDPIVVKAFLEVVKTHGEGFFVNSASAVAQQLEQSGAMNTLDGRCYVKKSMIAHQLQVSSCHAMSQPTSNAIAQ